MVKPNGSSSKSKNSGPRINISSNETLDTERRILKAARAEFISKGLVGARMQAIATDAGVNKALLHYYFRSKTKLYETTLKDILQSVWTKLRQEIESLGPSQELDSLVRTFVTTYIRTMAANPDFPLFMIHELTSGAEYLQPLAREMFKDFKHVPAALIKALNSEVKSGKIQSIEPVHFFLNLIGMCLITYLALPMIKKIGPTIGLNIEFNENFLDARIEAIVSMVFLGLRKKR
jgi:TetR/AcrR family transcriptional regulator